MRQSPPIITLLPGALVPGAWLDAIDLRSHLPAIGAALADGRLRMADVPLPEPSLPNSPLADDGKSDAPPTEASTSQAPWAHHRWLASLPALSAVSPSIGTLAAASQLLAACDPAKAPPPLASGTEHGWLMRPVNFRLTTDSMLMDELHDDDIDEALADRMLAAIRPLLADESHDIRQLSPTRWLLTPRPGTSGWQLQTSPLEATPGRHIDEYLPRGPDARRFRRLLNEIQMSWHQEALHEDRALPANAVWLEGPLDAGALEALTGLFARGLRRDDRLLPARLHGDLSRWLDGLQGLDRQYLAAGGEAFACLLCGQHQARWLFTPGASALLHTWAAAPEHGRTDPTGSTGRRPTDPASTPEGAGVSSRRRGSDASTASAAARPVGLLQMMAELLSPRAAWQALRERLVMARHGRLGPGDDQGARPPRSPEGRRLHTLLSES